MGCYAYGFASRLPYPYEVVDAVGGALATVMALVISHNDHKSQIRTSTSMIFFHLATTLVVAIQLRTFLLVEWFPLDSKNRDIVKLILSAAILFLSLLNFALENVAKTRLVYVRLSDSEEDSPLLDGPEEVASIWSRLFFSWLNPLMSAGHAKGFLEPQDLPLLNHSEQARTLSKQFGDIWDNELGRKGKDASLVQACLRLIGVYFLSAAPLKLLQDSLGFVQPTLLRLLIEFARSHNDGGNDRGGKGTQPKPQPLSIGYLIAAVMLGTAVLQSCALHQYFQICYMTGLRLRGAIVTQVYRKALRLSSSARQNATVGEMVNLLAVDAQRIMDLFSYLHILWSGPFQIIMSLYLLYGTLGYPAFAGVAIMIFAIPLNAYLARKSRELQKTQMGNRDSRIKMMDELLGGIKIIKLYAWESRFVERISDIRSQEMDTLRRYAVLSAIQRCG